MNIDIHNFSMFNVSLIEKGDFLIELEVPGLAEKRPSVLKGDCILAEKVVLLIIGWEERHPL